MALEKQTKEIEAKRKDVMADLAQVEPAVIEAQNGLVFNFLLILDFFVCKLNTMLPKMLRCLEKVCNAISASGLTNNNTTITFCFNDINHIRR